MNEDQFLKSYWNYFLTLEDDFSQISRYVTFEKGNFKCYSIEFNKQYQTICSEFDIACKEYCRFLWPSCTSDDLNGIMDYAYYLLPSKPHLIEAIVEFNDIEIRPLKDWKTNQVDHRNTKDAGNNAPYWWTQYNKVKHERNASNSSGRKNYMSANLENTANALASLFVILMNMYKDIILRDSEYDLTKPSRQSKLFTYKDWELHVHIVSDNFVFSKKMFEKMILENINKPNTVESID